ncbi:MAG: thioredoxin domain-containing protein [Candidatus Micrarchaeota archaeon]|nr:thioredoxin domain-containing protein [Candidatus Micrarchaeota archaeon]
MSEDEKHLHEHEQAFEDHEKALYQHEKDMAGKGGGEKVVKVQGSTILAIAFLVGALIISGAILVGSNSISASLAGGVIAKPTIQPTVQATVQPTAQPTGSAAQISVAGMVARGDANASVTIIEFSDYQCPYCGAVEPTIEKVMADYAGKVKLYFKNFPLSFHEFAQKASEAAECANDQGKFWEMHDKLFADQGALAVTDLKKYAKDLGLDTAKFNACLDGGQKTAVVQADFDEGSANGVSGTPAFFINGELLVGAQPYSEFKTVIDAALAG